MSINAVSAVRLSCAILAAAAACRESGRAEYETGYRNPVESTTPVPTGPVAAPEPEFEPAPAPAPAPPPYVPAPGMGMSMGYGTQWSGAQGDGALPTTDLGTTETTEPAVDPNAQSTTSEPNVQELAPGESQDIAAPPTEAAANSSTIRSRTVVPPRGRATTPRDPNDTTRAGVNTGTSSTGTSGASVPPPAPAETIPVDPAPTEDDTVREPDTDPNDTESPSSGTSGGRTGLNETASGHGTTTNTGVNTENQGTGGTDDPCGDLVTPGTAEWFPNAETHVSTLPRVAGFSN